MGNPAVFKDCLAQLERDKLYSAIPQRRSIRSFSGEPDTADMCTLSYACARCKLPGIRLEIGAADEKELFRSVPFVDTIIGTGRYIAVIEDTTCEDAALYAGFAGEIAVLEAAALGLGTCWVAGTYRKNKVNIALNKGEKLAAIIAVGVPADEQGKRPQKKKLTDICQSDPSGWPIWAYRAAEAVRQAPSALNMQPWLLSYTGQTLAIKKGKLGSNLDMGIALMHLLLGVGNRTYLLRLGNGGYVATLTSEDME